MSTDGLIPVPDDFDLGQTIRGFAEGQQVFGRYTLRRIVGRGGMGVVWLAHDEKLEQDIALKFLPEVVRLDAAALDELKRETRRSRSLTHPHVVRIHDFVDDVAAAAISMEFVDGATLSTLRVQQPNRILEPNQISEWVRQLCEALYYAHTKVKIVHRDLKPANLMVTTEGDMKVADFGIARSISDSVSRVTLNRGTSGTLVYMSPQQARGDDPKVSDDIYSVGATIYELLTSKPPFSSGNIYDQVLDRVPISMSERRAGLEIEGHPIPESWEQTVAACLAKDPAQRPASAREIARHLGFAVEGAPVTVAPAPVPIAAPPPKLQKAKNQALIYTGMTIIVLLLAGLGYYFGFQVPANRVRETQIAQQEAIAKEKQMEAQQAADAQKKAELESEAQKAAAAAEALRTQQEKARQEADHLASARGGLMVKTDPPGASVALGGEDVQTSPATFKSVKLGSYPLNITLDGYEPVDQTAEIKENQFADLGTIPLTHSTGSINVSSDPLGLDYVISQNGTAIKSGKTPATVDSLLTGYYDVSVTKGDWSIKGNVNVRRKATASYAPIFAVGSVILTSTPAAADVYQGNLKLGKTPLTLSNLRPGQVSCVLTMKGFRTTSINIVVQPNQSTTLSVALEKLNLPTGRWGCTTTEDLPRSTYITKRTLEINDSGFCTMTNRFEDSAKPGFQFSGIISNLASYFYEIKLRLHVTSFDGKTITLTQEKGYEITATSEGYTDDMVRKILHQGDYITVFEIRKEGLYYNDTFVRHDGSHAPSFTLEKQ